MKPDATTSEGSARRRPWWFGPPLLVVVLLYVLPLAGSPPATNPNEVVRIELAAAIAYWARFDLGEVAAAYGLSEDVSVRDGKIYSDKAPGLSMVSAPVVWLVGPLLGRAPASDLPAYWPLRHALTLLLVALPTAALAFMVGAAVSAGDRHRTPALAVIAALATPMWTYGTVYFGHASAALLATLAWLLLLGPPGRPTVPRVSRAALGGAAAGLAVATEYPTVLLAGVVFATLLARRTAISTLLAATAGAVAGVLPALVYHQIAFGAPWITGYSFKAAADMQAIIAHGVFGVSLPSAEALWGILFGSRRGLFFFCPLLLLAPVGLWQMVRQRGWRDAGPILAATAAYVLFAAGFVDWPAGWCAAARHLVPIIPLATVAALLGAVKLADSGWGAVTVVVLTAASAANAALTIVLTPFFPPEFGAPLAQLVLPSLADGAAFPNLLSSVLGIAPIAVAALTGATVLTASLWAGARLIPRDLRLAAVFLATVTVLLLSYSWQGVRPSDETELMRAQVLRRLGHEPAAEAIEASLVPAATTPDD